MFDYRVYPLANSLADKLCAMVETHDGKPSSRIKDLVDVAIYATTVDIDGGELCRRVRSEAGARGIVLPDRFSVPDEWKQLYEGAFKKLVSRTGLSSELSDIAAAEALAASLFDPVLARKAGDLHWDHESLSWEALSSSMARMDAAPPSFSDYCTIADTISSGRVVCGPLRCRRGGRRGLSPWQETIEFGSFAPALDAPETLLPHSAWSKGGELPRPRVSDGEGARPLPNSMPFRHYGRLALLARGPDKRP